MLLPLRPGARIEPAAAAGYQALHASLASLLARARLLGSEAPPSPSLKREKDV